MTTICDYHYFYIVICVNFQSNAALSSHSRFCDGFWSCHWCSCGPDVAVAKLRSPDGNNGLCITCGCRYRSGETAPQRSEANLFVCQTCGTTCTDSQTLKSHWRYGYTNIFCSNQSMFLHLCLHSACELAAPPNTVEDNTLDGNTTDVNLPAREVCDHYCCFFVCWLFFLFLYFIFFCLSV
jgi:hypothetical protein